MWHVAFSHNFCLLFWLTQCCTDSQWGLWVSHFARARAHTHTHTHTHTHRERESTEAVSCCSCHLPLLYIGLECGLTNNVKLADKFFLQSQSIAPQDPFVMHEMGVICFQNHELVYLALCYFDHFEVSAANWFVKTRWDWSTGGLITARLKDLGVRRKTSHFVHWQSYIS